METSLSKNSEDYKEFLNDDEQSKMGSEMRIFTTIAPYPPHGLYYIALKSEMLQEYVCRWLSSADDCYIGYCNKQKFSGFTVR